MFTELKADALTVQSAAAINKVLSQHFPNSGVRAVAGSDAAANNLCDIACDAALAAANAACGLLGDPTAVSICRSLAALAAEECHEACH